MNHALHHRGPDEGGVWTQGPMGLAVRRLSVIDVEHGHQPMMNEHGTLTVVFNGEIYNHAQLRGELEEKGYQFLTRCDTEVVLRAFEAWGDEAVERFNGMFAVAAYDLKKDRLFIARDRLGIKPLFYTLRFGALAFSSELDSLLRSGMVQGRLNPAAIDAFFTFLYVPAPDTIFEDVFKLCPGESLVFEKETVTRRTYWRPRFEIDNSWTLDSAAEAYLELLKDSVRLRNVADVPLGAFLSGGIDSSSVVAVLSQLADKQVKTFSIGFDDPEANELSYARLAARHFGTDHTEEIMKPDLTEAAAGLVRHFGEPFADSSAVPTWLVSTLARKHVTVALSGDGGDELFAGYAWAHMNRQVGRYRKAPPLLRGLVDTALHMAPTTPTVTKLRRFSEDSFLEPRESFRRRQTCFTADQRTALYKEAPYERIAACGVDRFEKHADAVAGLSNDDWMLNQDLRMYLPDDILTKVDRMSMAVSLEARVPLLDHRIVEFAATVPFALKMEGNTSKLLVKHAMNNILPQELLSQRKRGFSIPIQRWFREDLATPFREVALDPNALSTKFLNQPMIEHLFNRHASGRDNHGHHLWALLTFEHWLRYIETIPGINVSI